MTLIAWEKSLTPERQAELNRMARQAEAAREHDEENDWVRYSEHSHNRRVTAFGPVKRRAT